MLDLAAIDAAIIADLDKPSPWEIVCPEPNSAEIRQAATAMLGDLEIYRLEVYLIPSKYPEIALRGGKIRAVYNRNPDWYQQLCALHLTHRTKPRRGRRAAGDTIIKRRNTLRALEKISKGQFAGSIYIDRLMPFVDQIARRQRKESLWQK